MGGFIWWIVLSVGISWIGGMMGMVGGKRKDLLVIMGDYVCDGGMGCVGR